MAPMPGTTPALVRVLPRRALSRLVGQAARMPMPPWLLAPLLRLYARAYGADLTEMAEPLGSYGTFLEFFTRRLEPDGRTMPEDARAVAAPADGRVHAAGVVTDGTILQTKGVPYSLAELLDDDAAAQALGGGSYLTTYLAPGDYHRFHWPFDARVERVRHVPGDLWPVHPGAVRSVDRLFVQNERVVARGSLPNGAAFAIVPVGALNVGSIRLTSVSLRTNRGYGRGSRDVPCEPFDVRRGDEMGWFEMGSAIVMLIAADAGRLDAPEPGTRLRVGAPVGRLESPAALS